MIQKITDSTIDSYIKSNKKIILKFSAVWCGPCKQMEPLLEQISNEYPEQVGEIDVDSNPTSTVQYGIRSIPATIVFENGLEIDRKIGLISKSQVLKMLN